MRSYFNFYTRNHYIISFSLWLFLYGITLAFLFSLSLSDNFGEDEEGEGIILQQQLPWEGTERDYEYEEVSLVFAMNLETALCIICVFVGVSLFTLLECKFLVLEV